MRSVYRLLYRAMLRLHPAAFRKQFARDMLLDFEEALRFHGAAHLFRDALVSLARQWSTSILSTAPEPVSTPRPSLLAGNYIMIRDKPFSPLELARGFTANVALLVLCASTLNAGPTSQTDPRSAQGSQAQSSGAPQPEAHGVMLHAAGARPSFEVASIRPSAPDSENRFNGITMHTDSLVVEGQSMKDVIEFAYAVPNDNEFSGGPNWIKTDKFDIEAKPDDAEVLVLSKLSDTDRKTQMRLMVQSLLEERFRMQVSFATKDLPFYALVVAKDGLRCTLVASASDGLGAVALPPPPPPPPPGYVPTAPGHEPWREQPMHWAPHGWPFSLIVAAIAGQPDLGGRIVVDKTGLNGVYNCDVTWAHEGTDVPGPSFFTAIQEQMGLKLVPEHGPVETIVIDHIDPPTPN